MKGLALRFAEENKLNEKVAYSVKNASCVKMRIVSQISFKA